MKKFLLLCALLGVVQVDAHMSMGIPLSRTFYQGRTYARWEWNEPMIPFHPQPCHGTDPDGSVPPANVYQEGETITVRLEGSAFHNGGHCAVWYTDTENGLWNKIVDVKDCTVPGIGANFQVTLPPGMGSVCSDRCVFAWTWTPRVSGACEIYMTCADVRVTGSGSAPNNLVQINFNSLIQSYGCQRVDPGTHWTTHFGDLRLFGTNPSPNPNPTPRPTTLPPPVNSPTPRPTTLPPPPVSSPTPRPPTPQPTRSTVPVTGCTLDSPCFVEIGAASTTWWLSFWIKDADGNPVKGITKVEVAGQGYSFLAMTEQPWGPFQESMPRAVTLPLSVRIATPTNVFYACNVIDSLQTGKKFRLQESSPCNEAQGFAVYSYPKYSRDPSEIEETSGDGRDDILGDIALDDYARQQLQLYDWGSSPDVANAAITGTSRLWPSGVLVYTYDGTINSERRQAIETAMSHITQRTVISFRRRSTERDYVTFSAGQSGCWSYVGKTGGQQTINVERRCPWPTVVHEILHALGFWHEQSRPDRDNYITIMWNNINEANKHNFNKKLPSDVDDRGHAYDFNSIMHYGAYAFSNNGQRTIISKGGQTIGQRNGLSSVDVNEVNSVYSPITGPAPRPTPRPTIRPTPRPTTRRPPPTRRPTPRPTSGGGVTCYQNVPCYVIVASNANNNWLPIYFQDGRRNLIANSAISTVQIRPNGWGWMTMKKNTNPWFTYYSPSRAFAWPVDIRFYANGKWKVACNRISSVGGTQRTYFGFVDGWDCSYDPIRGAAVASDGADV